MTAAFWNRDFRRRAEPPPEPPDLVRESEHRNALAAQARGGITLPPSLVRQRVEELPVPRHPDVIVFGDWHPGSSS